MLITSTRHSSSSYSLPSERTASADRAPAGGIGVQATPDAPHRHLTKPEHPHKLQKKYRMRREEEMVRYYERKLKSWKDYARSTFPGSTSLSKREHLDKLMETFFRPLAGQELTQTNEINGTMVSHLQSAQLSALKIIAQRFHELGEHERCDLLHSLLSKHLRHIGGCVDAKYDPQREAIKMLPDLMSGIRGPNARAHMLTLLMKNFNSGNINTQRYAKGAFGRPDTISDLALQLIKRELKVARRDIAGITNSQTLISLQECYEHTVLHYDPTAPGKTRIHSETWRKVFQDKYLNPANFEKWHRQSGRLIFMAKRAIDCRWPRQKVNAVYDKLVEQVQSRNADGQAEAYIARHADRRPLHTEANVDRRGGMPPAGNSGVSEVRANLDRTRGDLANVQAQLDIQQKLLNDYRNVLRSLGVLNGDDRLDSRAYRKLQRDLAKNEGLVETRSPKKLKKVQHGADGTGTHRTGANLQPTARRQDSGSSSSSSWSSEAMHDWATKVETARSIKSGSQSSRSSQGSGGQSV